ncbi:hypothetical protein [Streptomyces sp. NPDC097619]|uniref:hypothetical protein n=1 Tax=Streptomyces sp. NPDC097619 TaxID=3157228 RepID=UPI0033190550
MHDRIVALTEEADGQARTGSWALGPEDRALAARAAAGLADAVGPAARQERLPVIERLEHLREALAVLAGATARTHGHLAWFLARAGTALTPVLYWRALAAEPGRSFGTVLPRPEEIADAENALRLLVGFLTATGTGTWATA